MADNRITLRLSNAELKDAPIRLRELVRELRAARRVLRHTQQSVAPGERLLDWEVIDLSSASPVAIALEPLPDPKVAHVEPAVVDQFFHYAARLGAGDLAGISPIILQDFEPLATDDPPERDSPSPLPDADILTNLSDNLVSRHRAILLCRQRHHLQPQIHKL